MKRVLAGILLALALAGWFFVWPIAEPFVTNYFPLPGSNEISAVRVDRRDDGAWYASIDYFYTGQPQNVQLSVWPDDDLDIAEGQTPPPFPGRVFAVRGKHTARIELNRPVAAQELQFKKVIAELATVPEHKVVANMVVSKQVSWPDQATWALQREIAAKSPQEVLRRATALTDAGDTRSLVRAKAIVNELIKRDPRDAGALDEMVRIESRAVWGVNGLRHLDTRERMIKEVLALQNENAFDELEELAANLRTTKSLTSSGFAALYQFHEAVSFGDDQLGAAGVTGATGDHVERYVRKWLKKQPNSTSAHLRLAHMYHALAWQVRGDGVASSLTEAQRDGFKVFMAKAQERLALCHEVCRQDPQWYALALTVMGDSAAPKDAYYQTFKEGFGMFPYYEPIYLSVAHHLTPKWGGSVQSFNAFALEVASKFSGGRRDAVYARIYSELTSSDASVWKVDCAKIVRGHEHVVAEYPSDYNINRAAFAAMQCSNKIATRRFLEMVNGAPYLPAWGSDPEKAAREYARAKVWAS